MCGIAGFVGASMNEGDAHAALNRMLASLRHRGPDGQGTQVDRDCGLGHVRLAIVDPEGGHQPMDNGHGTVWVSFNGEIYNHIELRCMLESHGHRFRTRSDTEVICHLYEHCGDRFVEHLNGQFALALRDSRRQRLVLARDRVGIRPLFHADHAGALWFASEPAALLTVLPGLRRIDLRALAQTFTMWSSLAPRSIFAGMHSLPPGHCLAIEADGQRTLSRYWRWESPEQPTPRPFARFEEASAHLRTLLDNAVRLRLRADVPVAAYLSGGLDSSVIAALIRSQDSAPLRTYSIAFEDAEFDESVFQTRMVRHLGTRHTTVTCTRRSIGDAFPQLIAHVQAPILRTAPAPLMLLARRVHADGFKVALTGEGADEVLGGYDLFKEAKVRRFCARQPESSWRRDLYARLYGYLEHSPTAHPALAQAFFDAGKADSDKPWYAHLPRWKTSSRAMGFLSADLRQALSSFDPAEELAPQLPGGIARWSPLARDQYVEAATLLPGYLLAAQGDRAAMAHSVEGRFPFLDHHLIEFANRLPDHWKIRGLTEKAILRHAVADLLPSSIARRTKQPYRSPDSSSFFVEGKPMDYVAELLSPQRLREAGYFDPDKVARLMAKCRTGNARGFGDNQAFTGIVSTMLLDHIHVRDRYGGEGKT